MIVRSRLTPLSSGATGILLHRGEVWFGEFLRSCADGVRSMLAGGCPPLVEGSEGALALHAVALALVPNFFAQFLLERDQQVEGDVGGVEPLAFSIRDVMHQRTESGLPWSGQRRLAARMSGGKEAGQQAGGNRFGVALDAGDLSGKKDVGVLAHLQRCRQHPG